MEHVLGFDRTRVVFHGDEIHVHELGAEADARTPRSHRHLLDLGLGDEVKHYPSADDPIVHVLGCPLP